MFSSSRQEEIRVADLRAQYSGNTTDKNNSLHLFYKFSNESFLTILSPDVHKDPDYDRRVRDYTEAFRGMDSDGDGTITFEVSERDNAHLLSQLIRHYYSKYYGENCYLQQEYAPVWGRA